MFIYLRERKRDRDRAQAGRSGGGGAVRGDRGSEAASVLTAESLMQGSNSQTVRS